MTELEATNAILAIIGEAPIDGLPDLTTNEISDSSLALTTLREVSTDIQAEGWSWNTDKCVQLTNNAGEVVLPSNALRWVIDPNWDVEGRYTVRGQKVYDSIRQTYDLGAEDVELAEMVVQLDWDDVPFHGQEFIKIRAGRIYADRMINSAVIYSFTAADEGRARGMLVRAEEAHQRNNVLHGSRRGTLRGDSYIPARGNRYRRIY